LCFLLKIPVRFVETLEIAVVLLGRLDEVLEGNVASTVAVEGIEELIDLLRW
jgi:hypothetical protein